MSKRVYLISIDVRARPESHSCFSLHSFFRFAQRLVTWLEEESNDLSWLPGANTPTGDQSASFAPQSPQQVIEQILWRMRSDGLAGATSYDVPRVEQDIELPTPNLVRPTSWIIGF